MLGFILFVFVFILFIGLIIISSIFRFFRSIFGIERNNKQNQSAQSDNFHQFTSKSKIFDKSEGEYVDYEELK